MSRAGQPFTHGFWLAHAFDIFGVFATTIDAMANSRQYRAGMGRATAAAVLREHAGAQWDERVVAALVTIVETLPQEEIRPAALDEVGRAEPYCGCGDALPAELVEAR